jgi:hypothetical protein
MNASAKDLPKLNMYEMQLAEYAYQFALLSDAVYDVEAHPNLTVPTRRGTEVWTLVGVPFTAEKKGSRPEDWGFKAGVYLNKKGSLDRANWRCAIVFSGTDDAMDILTDLSQASRGGSMPTQYQIGEDFALRALNGFPCKGVQTFFVGHSLGGGLAQYAYARTGERHITFTFNPAGLGFMRPEFYAVKWRSGNVISFVAESINPTSGQLVGRDRVSQTGITLGREVLVPVYSRSPTPHKIGVLIEGLGIQRDYCLQDEKCN